MANTLSNKSLGDVVREARASKGLSLRQLALQLNKTPSYLSDIENDRRIPAEDLLKQIAEVFGLDFDDLMARGGRFGEDTVRYVMKTPAAGSLFRRVTEHNLQEDDLKKLAKFTEKLASKKRQDK
jgi:transcriptional regulator with XRE-family HTH domain